MSNDTMKDMVDGQLAELPIAGTAVEGTDYKAAHAQKIKALADEADALPPITDKATLQANQDVLTKLTKARTGIDKWRKAWKEPWKKLAEQVDGYLGTNRESGLQAQIAEIEDRIEAKKKAYLEEQAKAAREAERLLEERYTGRVAKLLEAGMTIEANGSLTIRDGEQTMTAQPTQIRFATDEQMAAVLAKVEVIRAAQIEREEAARQAKEAEERERQEEAERLAEQKRVQEAEAAKLKAEREAFEREKAALREQKRSMRGDQLAAIGAYVIHRPDGLDAVRVDQESPEAVLYDLSDLNELQWNEVYNKIRGEVQGHLEAVERAKAEAARAEQAAKVEPEPVFETLAELTRPEPVPEFLRISDAQLQQMQAVFQALEEASMCWDPIPDGLFQSEKCKEVGDRLLATLKAIAAQ